LVKIQNHAGQHNENNDAGIGDIPDKDRDCGGNEKDDDQRVFKKSEELEDMVRTYTGDLVQAVLFTPALCLIRAQAVL
jgi:hypothetical protein